MTRRSFTRIGLALTAALALAACGNANKDASLNPATLVKGVFTKKKPPEPISGEQIAKALVATSSSVFKFELEARKAQVLMLDIQRSGPYQSYGNSARQVIVMRDGMITSTRGIGGDLMSSEEDALFSKIRSRSGGTVTYDQRFLTPEDKTIVSRFSCSVSSSGPTSVSSGLVQATGYDVTAQCTAADGVSRDFTNTYAVSHDGYILTSRQWVGPTIGYVLTSVLRR